MKTALTLVLLTSLSAFAQPHTNSGPGGGRLPGPGEEACAALLAEKFSLEKKYVESFGLKYKSEASFFALIDEELLKKDIRALQRDSTKNPKQNCDCLEPGLLKQILTIYKHPIARSDKGDITCSKEFVKEQEYIKKIERLLE